MISLAEIRTGRRRLPGRGKPGRDAPAAQCSLVEDLNWPVPVPPAKKPPRPEVWAPGVDGTWDGVAPTLH